MEIIKIQKPEKSLNGTIVLPASKSESNRCLVMQALAFFQSGNKESQRNYIDNLSEASDTVTLAALLTLDTEILDVKDAGTTMRFLTAYVSITNQQKILTGTPRMCERPIGILVEALKELGADIEYLSKIGYPPIQIKGFHYNDKKHITLSGDVSSQYISALLMIAPLLPLGLIVEIEGEIISKPYIAMTLQQMAAWGIIYTWENNLITIKPQLYQPIAYEVEADWSAASYWYSLVALADEAKIELLHLKQKSLQGDSIIAEMMQQLGVKSTFTPKGVILEKIPIEVDRLTLDFTAYPDLAPTLIVVCAAKNIKLHFTGVESLKIKETDRITALQDALKKCGYQLIETKKGFYTLEGTFNKSTEVTFKTYEDHRMAMALMPMAYLIEQVLIKDPQVVKKSYPNFWKDLDKIGFKILAQP